MPNFSPKKEEINQAILNGEVAGEKWYLLPSGKVAAFTVEGQLLNGYHKFLVTDDMSKARLRAIFKMEKMIPDEESLESLWCKNSDIKFGDVDALLHGLPQQLLSAWSDSYLDTDDARHLKNIAVRHDEFEKKLSEKAKQKENEAKAKTEILVNKSNINIQSCECAEDESEGVHHTPSVLYTVTSFLLPAIVGLLMFLLIGHFMFD